MERTEATDGPVTCCYISMSKDISTEFAKKRIGPAVVESRRPQSRDLRTELRTDRKSDERKDWVYYTLASFKSKLCDQILG